MSYEFPPKKKKLNHGISYICGPGRTTFPKGVPVRFPVIDEGGHVKQIREVSKTTVLIVI